MFNSIAPCRTGILRIAFRTLQTGPRQLFQQGLNIIDFKYITNNNLICMIRYTKS